MPKGRTARGFAIYDEFTDTYGHDVRVQASSAAFEDRCWIFLDETVNPTFDPNHVSFIPGKGGMHLSPPQAARIIAALGEWLADISAISDDE